jgi:hypothetical protein
MNGRPVAAALVRFWVTGTAILLLVVAVHIVSQPDFPLGLGWIRTTGPAGLWLTLVPALVGLAGVTLLRRPGRTGPTLVFLYSAFWSLTVAGALPGVWNAKRSFCLSSLCITNPWVGRAAALGLLAPFLLVALWAWRRPAPGGRTTK